DIVRSSAPQWGAPSDRAGHRPETNGRGRDTTKTWGACDMTFGRRGRLALMVCTALAAWASLGQTARADLYMSSGNRVFQFNDQTGVLINSAPVDPTNVGAKGLAIGPDGKLYAAISNGANKVVSFNLDLSNRTQFVAEGQGGLFTPWDLV